MAGMEGLYRWSITDMRTLRDYTKAAYQTMDTTLITVETLLNDIRNDSTWTGKHKEMFIAWMDLIRQYHASLAGELIGEAATTALSDFITTLEGFYAQSEAMGTLKGIG